MTRRNARFATVAAAVGGGTATLRRRRAARIQVPEARGMCFQIATLAAIDAGKDEERVVL